MARGRVLALRDLLGGSEAAGRLGLTQTGGPAAGRRLGGAAEAEAVEVRQVERAGAEARAIALPARAGGGDVAERVGAFVAESAGVGGAADAETVEYDQKGSRHGGWS